MDPILIAEIVIVGLIIIGQFFVFFRNLGAIDRLRKLFPRSAQLEVLEEAQVDLEQAGTTTIPQIKDQPQFSSGFREVLSMTNEYLQRNKGASQGERLQEIAIHKSDSMEEAIESNLPLPLYIGLFATFTGVIIGLVKIGITGVSDAAIQSFIGGVVVGMIGSAIGLILTVRGNQVFRSGREVRDQGVEEYFQFLRTRVIHPEAAPVSGSVKGLRDSLAAFQDGFAQYQGQMNESLGDTLRLFRELKDVFKQIRSVEQELRGIGGTVKYNDELIQHQVSYLESYQQKAEVFTQKLGDHFQKVDQQVEVMVDENIKALNDRTQTAYLKMDQYLASIDGTDRERMAKALAEDLGKIKDEVKTLQEKSVHINAQLLERVNQDEITRQQITTTMGQLSQRLQRMDAENRGFMASPAGQVFIYTGIGAFLLAIAGGAMYMGQTFGLF